MARNIVIRYKTLILMVAASFLMTGILLYSMGSADLTPMDPPDLGKGNRLQVVKSDDDRQNQSHENDDHDDDVKKNTDIVQDLASSGRQSYCNGQNLGLSDSQLRDLLWTIYKTNFKSESPNFNTSKAEGQDKVKDAIAEAIHVSKKPALRTAGLNEKQCASRVDRAGYSGTKNVLLWSEGKFSHLQEWVSNMDSCMTGPRKCRYTFDRTTVESADVVVFHLRGMAGTLEAFLAEAPRYRTPDQSWMLYVRESPFNTITARGLMTFRDVFNHSVHYSEKADVSVQYGECRHVSTLAADWPHSAVARQLLPVAMQHWQGQQNYAAGKTKLVAWFVSKCVTTSQRKTYAEELGNHVEVHIFGNCTKKPDCDDEHNCVEFLNKYKFYLAFENSLCKDYITEKVFKVLLPNTNAVPIVLGAGSYERMLPPHSYIDIMDFASARDLARYLQFLDKNPEAYNAYFDWRKQYACRILVPPCVLCDAIHGLGQTSLTTDVVEIFGKSSNCGQAGSYYAKAENRLLDGYNREG